MQKITPCIWFDDQAEEAAKFYTRLFKDASLGEVMYFDAASANAAGKPEGSVLIAEFTIQNYQFTALNGGSEFAPNPSISFIYNIASKDEINRLWKQLSEGGSELMPLDAHPFSDLYGWVEDRYGVSWQLFFAEDTGDQPISPSLLFVGKNYGRAEEAVSFYTSVFKNARQTRLTRYGSDQSHDDENAVMYAEFELEGQRFAAMDSGLEHHFNFSEGISFVVTCQTQQEIDYYWVNLSDDPKAEKCGWLKDKFGVSWQIVPEGLDGLIRDADPDKAQRVSQAMLQMRKLDINALEEAYHG